MSDHVHEWRSLGLVREGRQQCSPCSRWDDVLWDALIVVTSCSCGAVKRTLAGKENVRRRGDDLRRGRR